MTKLQDDPLVRETIELLDRTIYTLGKAWERTGSVTLSRAVDDLLLAKSYLIGEKKEEP